MRDSVETHSTTMKSIVVILLVFVSLSRSDYFSELTVDYGLPEKNTGVLSEIRGKEDLSRTRHVKAIEILFGVISNLEVESKVRHSKIAEAHHKVQGAIDIWLESVTLALGKCCSVNVETARKKSRAKLKDLYAGISAALEIAQYGNYSKNQPALERYRAVVEKNCNDLIAIDYDLIITCLETTDADILSVIKSARSRSLVDGFHMTNALFNAIKYSAAATVRPRCKDVALTFEIIGFQDKTIPSSRSIVDNKFVTLRTLYMNFHINKRGIVFGIAQSQYTASTAFLAYRDANKNIMSTAIGYLRRLDLGLGDDGAGISSGNNVSMAKTIAAIDRGDNTILDFILFVNPGLSDVIATVRKDLHSRHVVAATAFYNALYVAAIGDENYDQTMDFLTSARNAAVSPFVEYTRKMFRLIRGHQTLDRRTRERFTSLENIAVYGAEVHINKYYDTAIMLAKARRTGKVTKEDYSRIGVYLDEGNHAYDDYVQAFTAAGLFAIERSQLKASLE